MSIITRPKPETATPHSCTFVSDGAECSAALWLPRPRRQEERFPGVVLCNGLRGVKEWFLPEIAAELASYGLAALTFDYRGLGESGGVRGDISPRNQVADVRNALSFLEDVEHIDPQRLYLFGTGTGGSHAIVAAALDSRVRAIAAQAPLGNVCRAWSSAFERIAPRLRTNEARFGSATIDVNELLPPEGMAALAAAEDKLGRRLGFSVPLNAVEDLFQYVPEDHVGDVSPRGVLLFGCERDSVVALDECQKLYEFAREPKRLVTLDIRHYELFEATQRAGICAETAKWFATFQ